MKILFLLLVFAFYSCQPFIYYNLSNKSCSGYVSNFNNILMDHDIRLSIKVENYFSKNRSRLRIHMINKGCSKEKKIEFVGVNSKHFNYAIANSFNKELMYNLIKYGDILDIITLNSGIVNKGVYKNFLKDEVIEILLKIDNQQKSVTMYPKLK